MSAGNSSNDKYDNMLSKIGNNHPFPETVILSLTSVEIDKKGKEKTRKLLLTNKAIYILKPKQFKKSLKRIDFTNMLYMTISVTTFEFAVHIADDVVIRFKSPYKDRIVSVLTKLFAKNHRKLAIHKTERGHLILNKKNCIMQQTHCCLELKDENDSEDEINHINPYSIRNDDNYHQKNSFKLNWEHISNAIKHLLYDKVASLFMEIINKNIGDYKKITTKNINNILSILQNDYNINKNEIKYIGKIIKKARVFEPVTKANKASKIINDPNGEIIDVSNINTMHDIYSVYNCFLFTNYQFTQYKRNIFIKDIEQNNDLHINPNNISNESITKIKLLIHRKIPKIDLFPEYIIDDNMYDIWKYFFAASHFVNGCMQNDLNKTNNTKLRLSICIIPNRIISIFDENIIFPYDVNGIGDYLKSKKIMLYDAPTKLSKNCDLSTIIDIFDSQIKVIKAKQAKIKNIMIIIDRRQTNTKNMNKMYMTVLNNDGLNTLNELKTNYFISLQFNVLQKDIIRCYLFYGLGNMQRMRFYPKHLINIIPRFFKRDNSFNHYQRLYDGFPVNLNDPIFNKYYKIITKCEHYNRNQQC